MPALENVKHEAFALEYAEGRTLLEAHKAAGYVPDAGNAKRLRKRPEVRARIQELRQEAAEFANVRRVRVVLEVDRVGRANMRDYYERVVDAKGQPERDECGRLTGRMRLRSILDLPRELTAAIQEVEFGDDGQPIKLKLHDRNQANFTLLKYLGGLPEAPAAQTHVSIFNALSVEDQRILADALEALPGGAGDNDRPAESERSEA
jgi:phage terminase small subunit